MQRKKASFDGVDADRREFLAKAGKYAVIVPPAMTVLLSTSMSSRAIAQSAAQGNNGVGNGVDPPPPGDPPWNDPPGSGPGDPNNQGGPPFEFDPS